jgi:hypothetical protein
MKDRAYTRVIDGWVLEQVPEIGGITFGWLVHTLRITHPAWTRGRIDHSLRRLKSAGRVRYDEVWRKWRRA